MLPLVRSTPLGPLKLMQAELDDLMEAVQHKSRYAKIKQ